MGEGKKKREGEGRSGLVVRKKSLNLGRRGALGKKKETLRSERGTGANCNLAPPGDAPESVRAPGGGKKSPSWIPSSGKKEKREGTSPSGGKYSSAQLSLAKRKNNQLSIIKREKGEGKEGPLR